MSEGGGDVPKPGITRRDVLVGAGVVAGGVVLEAFRQALKPIVSVPTETQGVSEQVADKEIERLMRTGFILPDGSVAQRAGMTLEVGSVVVYENGDRLRTLEPYYVEVTLADKEALHQLALSVAGWVGERFGGDWGRRVMEARARRSLATTGLYFRMESMEDMSPMVAAQYKPASLSGVEVEGRPVELIRVKPRFFYTMAADREVGSTYEQDGRMVASFSMPRHLISHELKHWAHALWAPKWLVPMLRDSKAPAGSRQQMTPLANIASGVVGVIGALTARPKPGEERVGIWERVKRGLRAGATARVILEPVLVHDYPDESDHPPELFGMEGFDYVEPPEWREQTQRAFTVQATLQGH